MPIQIYNSQSHKKEVFEPIHPGEVRMYVCGPTVYDFLHVGNFRGAIFFNLVRNWFEHRGYKVTYIYNYTDVDDKIIDRAKKESLTASEVAETYIKEFRVDYDKLGLRPHSRNPRVTEFMNEIISFISKLIENNKAYEVNGDVYFDVHSFSDYGKLSNKNIEDLESGYRISVGEQKKNPVDFALWKAAKENEPYWDSPWGKGRPGWHIECSTMAKELLGDTIDIHGGGLDLLFPHHENEVAQSEACTGHQFVKYWMHNNMIQFGQQKMSKSLGNVTTARNFINEYGPEILKYMMLSSHYRSITDLNDDQILVSISGLARIYSSMAYALKLSQSTQGLAPISLDFEKSLKDADDGFSSAMDDDFNTPEALSKIFEMVRLFNQQCRGSGKLTPEKIAMSEVFYHWVKNKGSFMALFQEEPSEFLNFLDDMLLERKGLNRNDINQLVDERSQARKNKNYAESDRIRDELLKKGISILDNPEGTTWEVSK